MQTRPSQPDVWAPPDIAACSRFEGVVDSGTARSTYKLYDALLKVWPSPVVALNRAVAVAVVSGPAAALRDVEELERDHRLSGYRYLPAIKADLLRRLDRHQEAAAAYRQALDLAENEAERTFLAARLAKCANR